MLIEAGANVNEMTDEHLTPLDYAKYGRGGGYINREAADLLIAEGAREREEDLEFGARNNNKEAVPAGGKRTRKHRSKKRKTRRKA